MNLHRQLIRAIAMLAFIGVAGAATLVAPAPAQPECPLVRAAKPQRILLLDPIQKHPTWIDARNDSSGDSKMHGAIDSKHGELLHGAVAS